MSDHAYDISYLLDSEPDNAVAPALRLEKAPPAPSINEAVAAAQQAMARELLSMDAVHEALIQQYLRIADAFSYDDCQR